MNDLIINKLLGVGIALSSIKNEDKLYQTILEAAMDIVCCDAGTLYTVEENALAFRVMITRSQGIKKGGSYGKIELPPVPMRPENVCSRAAIDNKAYKIDDVYSGKDRFDFSGPMKYDKMTGYHTKSMLVVPMEDDKGKVIGVLQFINAMNKYEKIVPFEQWHTNIILSLASQAAICLTNYNYSRQLRRTIESIVDVLSTAIDALTPYNANHSRNMAKYGKAYLDWARETGSGPEIDDDEMHRFIMSIQLHDVGKLVTPLEVMNKETRLNGGEEEIFRRFKLIEMIDRVEYMSGRMSEKEYVGRKAQLQAGKAFIEDINKAGFLPDAKLDILNDYAKYTYWCEDDPDMPNPLPWITPEEVKKLSIRKGTLTDDERHIMENHVVMTAKLLDQMEFPEEDKMIPVWAADHHELLNGSGYPAHKKAEDLDWHVRLLTILDVFDALTARDRPYKPPMPIEKAFAILDSMANEEGKIDKDLLELFKQSNAWEEKPAGDKEKI